MEESVDYAENTLDYAESHLFMQPKSSYPRSRESPCRLILNKKKYIGIWAFPVIFICIWYVMKLSYQLCDVQ